MRRRLPPLNSLLAFEAAARHSNFSRAARELGVAQPAITRHIANLEDWLGAKLFKRSGNAVELSLVGYELAEMLTPAFDRLELGFREFTAARENEILIGASFGIMHMWLMPQITAMRGAAGGARSRNAPWAGRSSWWAYSRIPTRPPQQAPLAEVT